MLENVPPLISRGGLAIVLGDLAAIRYHAACRKDAPTHLYQPNQILGKHRVTTCCSMRLGRPLEETEMTDLSPSREHRLSHSDVVDFLIGTVAVEVNGLGEAMKRPVTVKDQALLRDER